MYNITNSNDFSNEKTMIGALFFICFGICYITICCSDKICSPNHKK